MSHKHIAACGAFVTLLTLPSLSPAEAIAPSTAEAETTTRCDEAPAPQPLSAITLKVPGLSKSSIEGINSFLADEDKLRLTLSILCAYVLASLIILPIALWRAVAGLGARQSCQYRESPADVKIEGRLEKIEGQLNGYASRFDGLSEAISTQREALEASILSSMKTMQIPSAGSTQSMQFSHHVEAKSLAQPGRNPSVDIRVVARRLGNLAEEDPTHQNWQTKKQWVDVASQGQSTLDRVDSSGAVVSGAEQVLVIYSKLAKLVGYAIAAPNTEVDGYTLNWFSGLAPGQTVHRTHEPAEVEFIGGTWTVKSKGRIS